MMYMMMPVPPIHATSPGIAVIFWAIIGLLVTPFLLATILGVVRSRRIAQKQSQTKEPGRQYEAFPQPQDDGQPQVHTPEEELLLRR